MKTSFTLPSNTLKKQLVNSMNEHLKSKGFPKIPEAGILLWNIFMQLAATRTYHMSGPNPISYSEIQSFIMLHGWPLQAHHIDIIRGLDDAWLNHAYSKIENKDTDKPKPSGALTADAFDAVFA